MALTIKGSLRMSSSWENVIVSLKDIRVRVMLILNVTWSRVGCFAYNTFYVR